MGITSAHWKNKRLHHGCLRVLVIGSTTGGCVAYFLRLIAFLLAFAGNAYAALSPTSIVYTTASASGNSPTDLALNVCMALNGQSYASVDINAKTLTCTNGGSFAYTEVVSCPANSTLTSPGSCTCTAGFTESGASCLPAQPSSDCPDFQTRGADGQCSVPPCNSPAGTQFLVQGAFSTPRGYPLCMYNCKMVLKPGTSPASDASRDCSGPSCGPWYDVRTMADFVATGGACTDMQLPTQASPPENPASSPTVTPEQLPPTLCPAGLIPGSVNGVRVCVRPGVVSTTNTSNYSQNPASSPSTDQSVVTNTNCEGGRCVTNTTTTTTSNSVTSVSTSTANESQSDYCSRNPRARICAQDGSDSSFSSACTGAGAAVSCTGDAIQCAIARDQHIRHCQLIDDQSNSATTLFNAEKNREGNQTTDLPGNETKTIGASDFSTVDAIGGSTTCITDKTVTISGKTFSLPFSTICPHLEKLGILMMSISFILAIRIVGRG